ncbi:MAG TPA: efflux RND transporter periplasmic adaptor subunit [Candidatus Limnocylindrales bacterium]|nr:efflux RND transporter periplasmic adaptor subunit [Candidatus Limnocylindrales bacterium]
MTGRKFLVFLGIIFFIALVSYFLTTPQGKDIPLVGVVDGNEVIVSPQITGRIVKLTVDEGSEVKKSDLIAELDRHELEASLAAAKANVASLGAQVNQATHNYSWTNDQTDASLNQARAVLTSTRAQLEQARANLWRDETDYERTQKLYDSAVASAQDRDHAIATLKASQANVKALEDSVKAQDAALAVAVANRKQVDVRKSELATTMAQLAQARAAAVQVATQLGYTEIYSPLDGIVSVRVAKQGEVVQQGSPIVVVVDVDHLWIRADVEETYIDSVQFGQKLKVQLPSGDILEGPVFFKGVEYDFATQRDVSRTKRDIKTFAIKVSIPNSGRRLFTGMTATVLLPPPAKKSWFARLWSKPGNGS